MIFELLTSAVMPSLHLHKGSFSYQPLKLLVSWTRLKAIERTKTFQQQIYYSVS